MSHRLRIAASALSCALAWACASGSPGAARAPAESAQPAHAARAAEPAPVAAPAAWLGAHEVTSNAGALRVLYRTEPDAIPMNEEFALVAWVFDARDPARPLADVELTVDAGMPAHGHGMNRTPLLERTPDGGFRARGLLFHMPGAWELYFDVARGAVVERAQVEVELE